MSVLSPTGPARVARLRLREPFNGLSHLTGVLLGIAALTVLVSLARGKPWHLSGFAIYGAALILLYLASTLYHLLPVSEHRLRHLLMFDRVGIYLLIAGTYTPLCLLLPERLGRVTLAIIWAGAAAGVLLSLAWVTAPKPLMAALYVLLGWVVVPVLPALGRALGAGGLALLMAGGLMYTVGAVVYARRRPDPFPTIFGFHEIFHLLVVAAAACHFAVVTAALRGLR